MYLNSDKRIILSAGIGQADEHRIPVRSLQMNGHILYKDEKATYFDIDGEVVVEQKIECPHCHGDANLVRACGVMMGSYYCEACEREE